ncbi:hypothetical protein [Kitasatospora sp. NPDC098663]|uniref:hypothetical protein n=1 Tax=Kitasatospora sp. NPDC098663 TaxID=3364096 RepID=UPI0037FA4CA0
MNASTTRRHARDALTEFTLALAARLPGGWDADFTPLATGTERSALHDRLWDLAHADWAVAEFVYERAGILRGSASRELVVLPRPAPRTEQYIMAPLLPQVLGRATDRFEDLSPHGITVSADPVRAAASVTGRLLPRYDTAIRRALPSPWSPPNSDPAVLREAVHTLFSVAELRLHLGDEPTGLASVLTGGGEYVCEHLDLPDELAPLIEAAARQSLLSTSGLGTGSLLDADTSEHLRRLSALPAAEQQQLLRLAAARLHEPPAGPRSSVARIRSLAPVPAAPASVAVRKRSSSAKAQQPGPPIVPTNSPSSPRRTS